MNNSIIAQVRMDCVVYIVDIINKVWYNGINQLERLE